MFHDSNQHINVVTLPNATTYDMAIPANVQDGMNQLADLGSGNYGMLAGDFNGDGIAEFLVANRDGNDLTFLANDGNGQLSNVSHFAAGNEPEDIVVADLDGDGDFDAAVSNRVSRDVTIFTNPTVQTIVVQTATTATVNFANRDELAPQVQLSSSTDSPTNANFSTVTIDFSENIQGFDLSDVSVVN